jgi:DNA segregation ATPase FtsK/SpoIIIE-like protein
VTILDARAGHLAATGQRVWAPSPDWPVLVIVIDEYAELVESAPEATGDADSIARRGRAVAVTLIAATQRPTQKAMGQGALRSQMDVRICFRVRERKDVDLVLGQGMLTAGWHAHKLNAPGKFLISAPEYDTPHRARAYLLTDQAVTDTATWHATLRPQLDEISERALNERAQPDPDRPDPHSAGEHADPDRTRPAGTRDTAEAMLWAALSMAGEDGISVLELMDATDMGRRWVYYRLRELTEAGRIIQTPSGNWRTADQDSDDQ